MKAIAVHKPEDFQAYATYRIDNNRLGVIESLRKSGVNIVDTANRDVVGRLLLTTYAKDNQKAINILKDVPYNAQANNWTTSVGFVNYMDNYFNDLQKEGKAKLAGVKMSSNFGIKDFANVGTYMGDLLSGSTNQNTVKTTTTSATPVSSGTKTTIILVGVGLTVILAGTILFMKTKN